MLFFNFEYFIKILFVANILNCYVYINLNIIKQYFHFYYKKYILTFTSRYYITLIILSLL